MKKIKLQNNLIVPVFNFLTEVKLSANKASRGRTQFIKRLEEKSKEFNEAATDIRKEYFKVDDNDDLIEVDGRYQFKDLETAANQDIELTRKLTELGEETFEIHFGEYSTKYDALFSALDNLEVELSGSDALAYNELMDAYEANEDKSEEEK